MQGQLRKEAITYTLHTECAHCGKELHIGFDGSLNYSVSEPDAKPLVFVPMVDFGTLKDPSIIDAF